MSGPKYSDGERPREGHGRRLSQANLREIRYETDIARSRARRQGKNPKDPNIIMFSCRCNCFYVDV